MVGTRGRRRRGLAIHRWGLLKYFDLTFVDFTRGSQAVGEDDSGGIAVARIGVVDFGGMEIEVRN